MRPKYKCLLLDLKNANFLIIFYLGLLLKIEIKDIFKGQVWIGAAYFQRSQNGMLHSCLPQILWYAQVSSSSGLH